MSYRLWVKCYGMADELPSPIGRDFIDMVQNHFLQYAYFCISPKNHFFNIMNFVGIASHIKCTFLSDYSIHFHVYMLISVYILIFLHIFCLGMFEIWHDRSTPSYLTEGYSDIVPGGHNPQDLT